MRSLKSAWLTPLHDEPLYILSLESVNPEPEHMRLKARDLVFPVEPTKKNPRRHTVILSLLDVEDIRLLRDVLDRSLETG